MRRHVVSCGCSLVLGTYDVPETGEFALLEIPALCAHCDANGGDYTKSPSWKPDIPKVTDTRPERVPRKR